MGDQNKLILCKINPIIITVLVHHCVNFEVFLPGHYYHLESGKSAVYQKYFDPVWLSLNQPVSKDDLVLQNIRGALVKAVKKRLMV